MDTISHLIFALRGRRVAHRPRAPGPRRPAACTCRPTRCVPRSHRSQEQLRNKVCSVRRWRRSNSRGGGGGTCEGLLFGTGQVLWASMLAGGGAAVGLWIERRPGKSHAPPDGLRSVMERDNRNLASGSVPSPAQASPALPKPGLEEARICVVGLAGSSHTGAIYSGSFWDGVPNASRCFVGACTPMAMSEAVVMLVTVCYTCTPARHTCLLCDVVAALSHRPPRVLSLCWLLGLCRFPAGSVRSVLR